MKKNIKAVKNESKKVVALADNTQVTQAAKLVEALLVTESKASGNIASAFRDVLKWGRGQIDGKNLSDKGLRFCITKAYEKQGMKNPVLGNRVSEVMTIVGLSEKQFAKALAQPSKYLMLEHARLNKGGHVGGGRPSMPAAERAAQQAKSVVGKVEDAKGTRKLPLDARSRLLLMIAYASSRLVAIGCPLATIRTAVENGARTQQGTVSKAA